jgi:nucleoside-diphosphate-sugar epimerase
MNIRRVFVAGAAGAIGRRLTPILVANGFEVAGTTRSPEKADQLERQGVEPFVLDVFDRVALKDVVADFAPDIVIHQLTDLPANLDPQQMRIAIARNARIRRDGTRNLVAAALSAGVRRIIAQSIAWGYVPGPEPHVETDPLDLGAAEPRLITIGGVAALEDAVMGAPGIEALVLRYGHLYGPGTGADASSNEKLSVHVDAAAHAAFLAVSMGAPGIYNVAEQDVAVTSEKARRDLNWTPAYRLAHDPALSGKVEVTNATSGATR